MAELFRIFKMTLPAIFSILNNASIRRNICLNFRKFTRENKPLFWQKWTPDVFFYFRPPCLCPSEGHKYGVSMLSSLNLCGTLCEINLVRNTGQTWGLDRVLIYLSSIACNFLDFIHWMVFDGVKAPLKRRLCERKRNLTMTFAQLLSTLAVYNTFFIYWFLIKLLNVVLIVLISKLKVITRAKLVRNKMEAQAFPLKLFVCLLLWSSTEFCESV